MYEQRKYGRWVFIFAAIFIFILSFSSRRSLVHGINQCALILAHTGQQRNIQWLLISSSYIFVCNLFMQCTRNVGKSNFATLLFTVFICSHTLTARINGYNTAKENCMLQDAVDVHVSSDRASIHPFSVGSYSPLLPQLCVCVHEFVSISAILLRFSYTRLRIHLPLQREECMRQSSLLLCIATVSSSHHTIFKCISHLFVKHSATQSEFHV